MEEWKEYKLGEIGTIVGGATPSTKEASNYDGEISWITPKDLSNFNNRFISRGERMITEKGFNSCSCKMLPKGSVLFSSRAPIGYVAIAEQDLCTNQGFKSVIPNENLVNNIFLYYLLVYNKSVIEGLGSGTTFKEVSGQTMKNVCVKIPSLNEQEKIATILSSLDDKIELNRRINDNLYIKLLLETLLIWWVSTLINDNLEQLAQALFKSWFVDFEPFKDGEFVESELGMIPKGWKVLSLDDMTSKFGTGLNPRNNFKLGEGNNFYVTIKNMGNNRVYLDDRCDKVNDEAIEKINKRSKLQKGDLLFSGIGTIGRVALITESPKNWNTSESVFNLHPQKGISSEFLYLLLLSNNFQNYVKIHAQGGVQQGIRMASLKEYKMAIPSESVLTLFDNIIIPIITQIKINDKEMDCLARNRDIILPKLMSGELKVSDLTL